MKVTPLDIRRKEFKRSVRGYSDEEVDHFLDEIADDFERLSQENGELQDRIRRVEEQLAGNTQLRDALEKTLITAQIQADQTMANARKESELILRDAELKARGIVSDSYSEMQRVQQALIQLKRLEEDFRFKFRSLLEGHLKLLDEAPIDMGPGQPVPAEPAPAEPAAAAVGESPFEVPAAVEEVPEYPVVPVAAATEPPAGAERLLAAEPPVAAAPVAATEETVALEHTMATEETVVVERSLAGSPATSEAPAAEEVPDIWGDEETTAGGSGAETIEQASAFAEFDDAEAPGTLDENTPVVAATSEDLLNGFFFSGRPENPDDVFLDGDKDGKTKARDFEW